VLRELEILVSVDSFLSAQFADQLAGMKPV